MAAAANVLRRTAEAFAHSGAHLWRNSVPAAAPATQLAPAWVFLGPPGVGKGTYSSRVAEALGIPHISAGDLVRDEIKSGSRHGQKMADVVNSGALLPDGLILDVLHARLDSGRAAGENGVLLDGFPRTRAQAEALAAFTDVQMALNLHVNEEILIAKCLGRRICTHCGKNYNVADIYIPESPGQPEVRMPPLNPPPQCEKHMERRADDTLDVVKRRLQVYHASARPVEDFFREQGVLREFYIAGGIPETMPRLMAEVAPFRRFLVGAAQQPAGSSAAASAA